MVQAGAAECAHGARPPGTRGTPARPLSCSQVRHDCNGSSHRPRPLDLHRLTLAAIDTTMSVGWQTVGRALRQGRLVDEPPPAAPTRACRVLSFAAVVLVAVVLVVVAFRSYGGTEAAPTRLDYSLGGAVMDGSVSTKVGAKVSCDSPIGQVQPGVAYRCVGPGVASAGW